MIWLRGRIVAEDELRLSANDRTFEHGLGLFETMRTWNGRPSLLARHLARMQASAAALNLPLERKSLPDASSVAALVAASGISGDLCLRLVMSGGTDAPGSSVAWMRALPIGPAPVGGFAVELLNGHVDFSDPLACHKTLNYWRRRLAYEFAHAAGADEALMATADGRIWEATRSNLFCVRGGRVLTPGPRGPFLPGVMRGLVLELAREQAVDVNEADIVAGDLLAADEVFLTNAVRGIVPVDRLFGRVLRAPGPVTERLSTLVWERLTRGDLLAAGEGGTG